MHGQPHIRYLFIYLLICVLTHYYISHDWLTLIISYCNKTKKKKSYCDHINTSQSTDIFLERNLLMFLRHSTLFYGPRLTFFPHKFAHSPSYYGLWKIKDNDIGQFTNGIITTATSMKIVSKVEVTHRHRHRHRHTHTHTHILVFLLSKKLSWP